MTIFSKVKYLSILFAAILGLTACIHSEDVLTDAQAQDIMLENMQEYDTTSAEFKEPQDPRMIRTTEGANALDLETPLRCNVNWNTQQMVLTLPYIKSAFKLERNGQNDPLPRFEVTGFTFDMMPAEKAIAKLTRDAEIRV